MTKLFNKEQKTQTTHKANDNTNGKDHILQRFDMP
jgi:hypothetical protein